MQPISCINNISTNKFHIGIGKGLNVPTCIIDDNRKNWTDIMV